MPSIMDDDIVISGISGRFPESDNMHELRDNLMNKVDLITEDDRRWKLDHAEIPKGMGKINNLEKFDANFFSVYYKQAHTMDPMCRMLMEHAYEAIIDAGINPKHMKDTNTGVFIGACFSESEKTWFYEKTQINGLGITGCSRAMMANRISYWLGVHGPSYSMDSACSSSLIAMEHAYRALREGVVDAALVGGCNLVLHPYTTLQFSRLGVLSSDARCKTFDQDANGYVRSEAVCVVLLQKAKDAKRIYATFVHAKTNCDGFKEQGITFPSSTMQAKLLRDFYNEINFPSSGLDYLEAHGTGTQVGDPEELSAIDQIFCKGRKEPLLIGSIKSNLGHSEPASGLCSVAKVIIGMETGLIPPNMHLKNKRKEIPCLAENKVLVVTEPTPWKGGYVGINSFGFGGANAHLLLKSWDKEKVNDGQPNDDLPRVVGISGRTEEAVISILNDIESRATDVEYIKLLHDLHSEPIRGHLFRGYTIMPPRGYITQSKREIQNYIGTKRPIWFLFSGMGSQWSGMGQAFMRLPVFAEAIKKCDAVLKPHKIDILKIITSKDKKMFDNILNSFVGIAAIQIGLVDLLHSVGITPDNIIGHSVGELGCAYADGCLTAEQMILSAYSRGLASVETEFIHGSMAAVGLGYHNLKPMCPADIEIACYNSSDSATISGPAESVKAFVAKLQSNNIFAREVACSNIPYHSRYIASAGPKLLAYMQKVIPEPKPRSSKWLSTSVPSNKWNTPAAQFSSAEYYTNNLLNPVLFEETAQLIPKDAIVIEIAPHGLLQAILKRSLLPSIANIALTKRDHPDNVEVFAEALGKMFNIGLQPQLEKLYPHVAYPVSRSTPMISPLVKWSHSDDWYVTSYSHQEKLDSGERLIIVTLGDEDFEFMNGHVIDGRNLFPATGYLYLVWETMALMRGEYYTQVGVVFEDVRFLRATPIPAEGKLILNLMLQKGTGRFEIIEDETAVVTGYIKVPSNIAEEKVDHSFIKIDEGEEIMKSDDIYKEFRLRGYQYCGLFCGIKSITMNGAKGQVYWHNNWVTFLDNLLQVNLIGQDTRSLYVPTAIQKFVIDPKAHYEIIRNFTEEDRTLPVYYDEELNTTVCGGVEIRYLKANAIPRKKLTAEPVIEEYKFVPHMDRGEVTLQEVAQLATHICLENIWSIKVKTVELIEKTDNVSTDEILSPFIFEALANLPLIHGDVTVFGENISFKGGNIPASITIQDSKKIAPDPNLILAVGHKLLVPTRTNNLINLLKIVVKNGFIITREDASQIKNVEEEANKKGLHVIFEKKSGKELFILLKKSEHFPRTTSVVHITKDNFNWVEKMKEEMEDKIEHYTAGLARVVFVNEGDFESGFMGFLNCLKKEPGGEIARGIFIQDPKAPKFSLQDPFYEKQLQKDLTISVLRPNGVWGSYRHLYLEPVKPIPVKHIWANQVSRGDLSSMSWFEGPTPSTSDSHKVVNIEYSSINFRDVMLASGKLTSDVVIKTRKEQQCILGFEFSGVTVKGKRVMGMIESRALASTCVADLDLLWQVPDHWTLEDAATVPCVYATSYYALYFYGKMKKGDKVLIHSGTGGVGQAAINLALHEGCEVFTTVGTPQKRRFILENFPQIPETHIGSSRDTSFEQMVLSQTKGRGVDIVLNSLAEEKLQASVKCLGVGGRFLEIGKFDLAANNYLGMECFLREISFHGVLLDKLFDAPSHAKINLRKMLEEGLKKGAIKPLVRTIFTKDQVEKAFRYMASGKHIGKVIVKINDEQNPSEHYKGYPYYHCLENRSYLILGGLGGFGLELIDWLILRGAKYIVITSRTGVRTGYQAARIKIWESYGVKIDIIAGKDAANYKDCQSIIERAQKFAPIDAIFNLAVVLRDALWKNQTPEAFEESFRGKAWTIKNMDILSRKLCPQLRKFVVFSSVSSGRGNAGQTNYGMSNSVMERICEIRAREGFPALAVQWGTIGDVGLVADMMTDNKEIVIGGTLPQKISSCLQVLDGILNQNATIVSSMVVADKKFGAAGTVDVVQRILDIMGLKDISTLSTQTSLAELGMDSMMAVEIKQTLELEYNVILTAQDIRNLNFAKLQEISSADNQKVETEDVLTGMKILMRTAGSDIFNKDPCITLDTATIGGKKEIFLFPGIEGNSIFNEISPKLHPKAFVLQYNNPECDNSSIESLTNYLLPHILKKVHGNTFSLVAYSFGCVVAAEIARKLELKGLTGKMIFIDGSPDMIKFIVNQQLLGNNDEELDNSILTGIMDVFDPHMSAELIVNMGSCKTWTQKLEVFRACIQKTEAWSILGDEHINIIQQIRNRIFATKNYNFSVAGRIKAPILLLKPTIPTVASFTEDYNISNITEGKVEVHYAEGNHRTIIDNKKIVAAINDELHNDEEEFKKQIYS